MTLTNCVTLNVTQSKNWGQVNRAYCNPETMLPAGSGFAQNSQGTISFFILIRSRISDRAMRPPGIKSILHASGFSCA